ncbi:MAG TPA: LD-carboxypeptidase [Candidatus Angelobacter sp.]|nr:LD-carboxypeptidase [Candidatus Angelobacter sp.]
MTGPKIFKPPALRPGDQIGLMAPASSFKREAFIAGCDRLRQMGYEPVYSEDIFERDLYFAGSAERRWREFEELLLRDDVKALIGVRGGYGSNYLLERLDFKKFSLHPKIILGCSDLTSLLTAINDRAGLVTFHGPMLAKDISAGTFEASSWERALGGATSWSIPADGVEVVRSGRAQGKLYGGCLSLLTASLGTPYEVQTDDKILFAEDVGEKPYQIDRMLMHLHLAGKLKGVRGFIFGEMLDCVQPGGQNYTLQQVIARVLEEYQVPIVYGLRSGHVSGGNITLPLGVQAELIADASGVQLKILEAATDIR